jgi:hypothetical protein
MLTKTPLILSVLCLATLPAAVQAENRDGGAQEGINQQNAAPPANPTGGQSYGDRNRGGPYGFYSYPRHRHVNGGSGLDGRPSSAVSAGTSPYCDSCHGSAYYGRDYGAPYFGGGYYDRGVYYRERRD